MGIHCKNQIRASRSKQSTSTGRAPLKVNSCLRVKEIDPFEVSALQKLNSCLKVKAIDLYRKSTAKSKFVPQVNEIDLYKKSTVKIKFASGHRNRPLQEEHCKNKICLSSPNFTFTRRAL